MAKISSVFAESLVENVDNRINFRVGELVWYRVTLGCDFIHIVYC
jgi:hypothetical protein